MELKFCEGLNLAQGVPQFSTSGNGYDLGSESALMHFRRPTIP